MDFPNQLKVKSISIFEGASVRWANRVLEDDLTSGKIDQEDLLMAMFKTLDGTIQRKVLESLGYKVI